MGAQCTPLRVLWVDGNLSLRYALRAPYGLRIDVTNRHRTHAPTRTKTAFCNFTESCLYFKSNFDYTKCALFLVALMTANCAVGRGDDVIHCFACRNQR